MFFRSAAISRVRDGDPSSLRLTLEFLTRQSCEHLVVQAPLGYAQRTHPPTAARAGTGSHARSLARRCAGPARAGTCARSPVGARLVWPCRRQPHPAQRRGPRAGTRDVTRGAFARVPGPVEDALDDLPLRFADRRVSRRTRARRSRRCPSDSRRPRPSAAHGAWSGRSGRPPCITGFRAMVHTACALQPLAPACPDPRTR